MSLPARIAAILTDLDGTLVDSEAATARVAEAWVATIPGARLAAHELTFGQPSADIARDAAPHLGATETARLGDAFDDRLATETDEVRVLPGAVELLAAAVVPVAVVTSSTRRLALARLAAAGLAPPGTMVCADEVARGKPGAEPYRRGAALVGRTPGACVALEDTPTGIFAARAAGVPVLGLATTRPVEDLVAAGADAVLDGLADALPVLRERGALR